MFGSLGVPELFIILLIVIIIFGANKLPQLGKGLGQGLRNFKDSVKGDETEKPSTEIEASASRDRLIETADPTLDRKPSFSPFRRRLPRRRARSPASSGKADQACDATQ